MKRKVMGLVSFLITIALVLSISACSSDDKTKISFWAASKSTDLDALLEKFRNENPNIELEFVYVPYGQALADITTGYKGGKGPDVVELIQSWAPRLASEGYIRPMNELIEKNKVDTNSYFKMGWDAFDQNGKVYAMPTRLGVLAMYYNKELLKLAGFSEPPKTWDEFTKLGEELKKQGKYAYGVTAGTSADLSYRTLSWLFTAGGEVADKDWKTSLINDPKAVEALEYETNMMKAGYAPASGVSDKSGDVYLMFVGNQVATMVRGPLDMFAIYKDYPDFYNNNLVITSMPQYDSKTQPVTASYVYGYGMAAKMDSKKEEAAWKLISFLSQPENITKVSYGDLPAKMSALDHPGPALLGDKMVDYKNSLYSAFLDQAKNSRVVPTHPAWAEISQAIWDEYQLVLGNKNDAKSAADKMKTKIDKILADWNALQNK